MNSELLAYYRIIGQIQKNVQVAATMEDAVKGGLRIIEREFPCDEIILWYADESGELLHPYFWLGDRDFTTLSHKVGEGMVGRVFITEEALLYDANEGSLDPETQHDFPGMDISGALCVLFSDTKEKLGCIQLVRTSGPFSEEFVDALKIFSTMLAISISENAEIAPRPDFTNTIMQARNIKKSFKNGETTTEVLKGVNLDVFEGEFLAVLGESGCGKSTFLNIIGGLERADSGSFTYLGNEMANANEEQLTAFRRNNIGFIFQSYNLMPNLTARQNLNLIGELAENPMTSEEALSLVGLSDKMNSYPSQLSGGQQQRVSIARALIKRPKLIFADEPTAALDYATSIEVLSVLEKVIETGTTLVMVTHNEEISRMANRVIRFRNGKTHEITVNRLRAHPKELVW